MGLKLTFFFYSGECAIVFVFYCWKSNKGKNAPTCTVNFILFFRFSLLCTALKITVNFLYWKPVVNSWVLGFRPCFECSMPKRTETVSCLRKYKSGYFWRKDFLGLIYYCRYRKVLKLRLKEASVMFLTRPRWIIETHVWKGFKSE